MFPSCPLQGRPPRAVGSLKQMILPLLTLLLLAGDARAFEAILVEQSEQAVTVRIDCSDLLVLPVELDGEERAQLHSRGASLFQEGEAAWLSAPLSLAVPPGTRPSLRILREELREESWPAPLRESTAVDSLGRSGAPERPGLRLLDLGWMRSQKIQRLAVDLAVYAGSWRRITALEFQLVFLPDAQEQARLALADSRPGRAWRESAVFERQFDRLLLNHEQARGWRRDPRHLAGESRGALANLNPALDDDWILRLMVDEDGLVKVTGEDLRKAGVDLAGIDPATLSLWEGGRELPLLLQDGADGVLHRSDFFVFAGRKRVGEHFPTSFYGPERAYFLTWGRGTGRRYIDLAAAPVALLEDLEHYRHMHHFERDAIWTQLENEPLGPEYSDHWLWRQFTAVGTPATFSLTVTVNDALGGAGDQLDHIRFAVRGNSIVNIPGADHHAVVRLDGQWVGDLEASNQRETITNWYPLPPGLLADRRQITLEFELPLDRGQSSDLLYLNWLDIAYLRTLLVFGDGQLQAPLAQLAGGNAVVGGLSDTNPLMLREDGFRLLGAEPVAGRSDAVRFHAGAGEGDLFISPIAALKPPARIVRHANARLRETTQQADNLIVAPASYHNRLQELADFHRQGMSVKLVDIEAVYSEFGGGMLSAQALQDFVQHAFTAWQAPSPSYLTLVGKASYANQMELSREPLYRTQVPTWWTQTNTSGATATDEPFTYLVGQDTLRTFGGQVVGIVPDTFQDLFVGRISVHTSTQLDAFLAKHRQYREGQNAGRWMETQVMAADQGNEQAFEVGNELVARYIVPRDYPVAQIHVRGNSPYRGGALDFIDLFNAGCSVLNYNGHGSRSIYSSSSLFRSTDIRFLTNNGMYPICFAWSCNVGDYDNPDSSAMSELLLHKANAGAIAYYASSAKATINVDNPLMTHYFFNQYDPAHLSFGEIVQLTENTLLLSPGTADVIHMYNLQGDPALVPALPRRKLAAEPAMLMLDSEDPAIFVVRTDPPGLGGTLEITFLPYDGRPSNFQGNQRRVWNQAFSDGQTVTLTLPAITEARKARLLLAMNTPAGRVTGYLPLFLNLPYAGISDHQPTRGLAGAPLTFTFESPLAVDSVQVLTNFWPDSLARMWMQALGEGRFTRRIAHLPAHSTSTYRQLTREWMSGWEIPVNTWPPYQLHGLIYRMRIYDGEPYTDSNGNGSYNAGEPYVDVNGNGQWDPPGEPFNDINGNGLADAGEPFQDLNGNGIRDGWIELPGAFVSVLDNERLSAVDTLITVRAVQDSLAAALRWSVSASQPVDEASLRLARENENGGWVNLWEGRLPAGPGTQHFQQPVALGPGPQRLRFTAGPLWLEGTELSGVDNLVLADEFLLLTPGAGSGGALGLDGTGHWRLELPAGRLQEAAQLNPALHASARTGLRESTQGQPGLGFLLAAGPDSLWRPLDLAPRSAARPVSDLRPADGRLGCLIRPGARFQFNDGVLGDSLPKALARWVPTRGLWVVQPGTVDSSAVGWEIQSELALQPGWLAPVALRDQTGPALAVQVAGQWFASGDMVAREPVFQFYLSDPDGIDLGEGRAAPLIRLNGQAVPAEQLQVGEGTTGLHVQWSPGRLEPGSQHELSLQVHDALGNGADLETSFRVASDLSLDFFANHPNPFQNETVLAWQLSNLPRSLRFEIYTASGRLVRRLSVPTPRLGYDELVWDGRDQEGREVANGVYFVRVVAGGNGSIDETFKLARLK
jgi:hypothetical protein